MGKIRHVILIDTLNEIHPKGRISALALTIDCCEFLLSLVPYVQLFYDIEMINDTMKKEKY